ncbi:alpha-lytic protease prodomain-containing protein [Actinophytocola xanthii]|uniref:Peptidase S1A alpha-lytic prodomain domain-containing protein n=1 Tax=Actinophytocola xanthii TaxID=1912961 RepID=A0A1Q8CQ68_9PSEU|nr:alpha-lytic protease prodomain-containing protein [Actinophytocola xanthii]OLF16501.1 hypothetical protein BU204_16825 [Actinophytocola xanthii]
MGEPASATSVADVALQRLVEEHPRDFGGLYLDLPSGTAHVNVVGEATSAPVERAREIEQVTTRSLGRSAGGLDVRVHEVKHSLADLQAVASRIKVAQPWAEVTEGLLTSWAVDPITNSVRVGLTTITPEVRAAARGAFGDTVTLFAEERLQAMTKVTPLPEGARVPVDVSRDAKAVTPAERSRLPGPPLIDFAPYVGGDRMWRLVRQETAVMQCTAGFMWHNGGTVYSMSSAGHCGRVNYPWTQGYFDQAANTLYETGPMGTPYVSAHVGNGGVDAMLMDNGEWIPYIWENTFGGSHNLTPVTYLHNAIVGQRVCFNGSFTMTKCSGTVRNSDACYEILDTNPDTGQSYTVISCNLVRVESPERIVQWGDSGGPVFYGDPRDGGVGATGIISAGNSAGTVGFYANRNGIRSHFAGDFARANQVGAPSKTG